MTYHGREQKTIHPTECKAMTWEDAEKMEKLNQECGWGFSTPDLLRFTADHMDAYMDINEAFSSERILEGLRTIECIEWRLTDANFHTFCEALHAHEYNKAINMIANDNY